MAVMQEMYSQYLEYMQYMQTGVPPLPQPGIQVQYSFVYFVINTDMMFWTGNTTSYVGIWSCVTWIKLIFKQILHKYALLQRRRNDFL